MATILAAPITGKPAAAHQVKFDSDSQPVFVDNCATSSITNDITDCITAIQPVRRKIKGIAGLFKTEIYSTTIKWHFEDDNGAIHTFVLPRSFYIPSTSNRLFSPQHWAQVAKDHKPNPDGTRCITTADNIILEWNQREYTRTIPLNRRGTNVGQLYTANGMLKFHAFCCKVHATPEEEDENPPIVSHANLIEDDESIDENSPSAQIEQDSNDVDFDMDDEHNEQYFPQRDQPITTDFLFEDEKVVHVIPNEEEVPIENPTVELLRVHHRLGHLSFAKIQEMARRGELPKRLGSCAVPACTACMYGKATKKPWRVKGTRGTLDVMTRPGQCVSVDQLISTTPGYIAHLRGTPTRDRYRVATVFVDHYSGIGYVHLQRSTSAADTIEAKERFEAWADTHGVAIMHYHADNGIFADNQFRKAVRDKGQRLTFSGVNAHFQSGMAERRIRDLQDSARTMLLHAHRRRPSAITPNLWPYAVRYASDIFNSAPMAKHKNTTPLELFSGSPARFNLRHAHTFGCPSYVLDNALQSGKGIPKWSERSRVGIFLGYSAQHSRTVGLILSLSSGLSSPQFHVQYDDRFETMRRSFGEAQPVSYWQQKAGFRKGKTMDQSQPDHHTTHTRDSQLPSQMREVDHNSTLEEPPIVPVPIDNEELIQPTNEGAFGVRRSQRQPKPTMRYQDCMDSLGDDLDPLGELAVTLPGLISMTAQAQANPDVMYWHEAMRQPDRLEFIKAAQKEVQDHTANGLWEVVRRQDIPPGSYVTRAVWSCVRKRKLQTGEIYKWKSRLAFDGSRQTKGVNYWETYAPVVQWPVVRYVLTTAISQGWAMKQIDYVLAYTQAVAETDMYMEAPRGFTFDTTGKQRAEDFVLKIKRNYYGQKQAARVWNKHLVQQLEQVGFKQSDHDECVFYKGRSLYILYTDDSILTGPDPQELDDIITQMQDIGLKITYEDGVEDFLGVNITKQQTGHLHLSQTRLIDAILDDLRLPADTNTRDVPAATTVKMRADDDGEPFDGHFNYRSVIGKLNFLEKSTRPDISYAVHQCARFSANPKQVHGRAVKQIGRYLAGTRSRGLVLKPQDKENFDVYADADFCGNFNKTDVPRSDMARSRSGYVIFYGGCPIVWASKLQSEIALSTTEAEIISLSTSLRTVIPLMHITKEMKALGFPVLSTQPRVHCRAFEDNNGAYELATVYKYRPRTRYLCTKLFHFKSYVEKKEITILPCDTELQTADIFTKALDKETFERHRTRIMGW